MTKERYDPELFALPEAVADGQHIVATYFLQTPAETDIVKRCLGFATEQTTGTWVDVPGETSELRCQHAAKLVGLTEVPDYETGLPSSDCTRSFVVRLAFPWRRHARASQSSVLPLKPGVCGRKSPWGFSRVYASGLCEIVL